MDAPYEREELVQLNSHSDINTMKDAPTHNESSNTLANQTIKNFTSGIVGGGCEAIVGYPLETLKTRMQTQSIDGGQRFTGTLDGIQKSIKNGGLSSLYRGASPQIFRSALSASVLFGLMGQYRYYYSHYVFPESPSYSLIAAGISTGFTEGILYTPFEVIKIRMQTQSKISNWQCLKQVVAGRGLQGLYRGFKPMVLREMLGNTVFFLAYETGKAFLLDQFIHKQPPMTDATQHLRTYQAIAIAGGYAGFAYWLAVFPIDTVKSILQADNINKPKYSGILDCCNKLYRTEGVRRFYRGLSPTLIRAFPANSVMFVAFEKTFGYLDTIF